MPLHNPPRLACVLVPHLPIQLERQRRGLAALPQPQPHGAPPDSLPLLIPHPINAAVVYAASPDALEAGVQIGMSLYQAQQMLPHALVVEPDEHAYHACHGALQAALQAYTAAIETTGLGELLLDTRALAAQHSGDDALARALGEAARAASSLTVQVGLAAGKFTAQQAARRAPPNAALVVPPGGEARFLAPLPVSLLPNLPGEMRRRLGLFDLHTLGGLVGLRKPAVLRQFGGEMSGLYELARGNDPRPLNPDVPPLRLVRSLQLTSPVSQRQTLLNASQRLCGQLCKTLNHKGFHAEGLKLVLYDVDGLTTECGQAVKPPTSDENRLRRLAAVMLGRLPVKTPVAAIALSVYPLRSWHFGLHQAALVHQATLVQGGLPARQARFEETLQLLGRRFGQAAVRVASLLGPPLPVPIRVGLDGQGLPARVDCGGQHWRLAGIDETWREERQWWDARRPLRRDYYRVVLADGSMRKIFCNLLNDQWYLDRSWPIL